MENNLYNIIPEEGVVNIIESYKKEMEFVVHKNIIECDKKLYRIFRTVKRKYMSMTNTIFYIKEYDKKIHKSNTIYFMFEILQNIYNGIEKYKSLNEKIFKEYYTIYNNNEFIIRKMDIDLIDIIEKYIIVKKYLVEMEFEIKKYLNIVGS